MKYYSAATLPSVARPSHQPDLALLTDEQIRARLRARLRGLSLLAAPEAARVRLADELGLNQATLSRLLRGQMRVTEAIAERLGFKPVTRFEPIGP
jgi:hypothetical protein